MDKMSKEQENIRKALFSIDRNLGRIANSLDVIADVYKPVEQDDQISIWNILKDTEKED